MGFWEFFFGIKPGSKSPVDVKKEVAGVCLGNFVGDIAPNPFGVILTITDAGWYSGPPVKDQKGVKKSLGQGSRNEALFIHAARGYLSR